MKSAISTVACTGSVCYDTSRTYCDLWGASVMTNSILSDGNTEGSRWIITRRRFLKSAAATVIGSGLLSLSCARNGMLTRRQKPVRFGIVTDSHYADADPVGTRHYRASLTKMSECVAVMNAGEVEFLVELGDFKDQDRPPVEGRTLTYVDEIEGVFQQFNGPTYHVLGNHDMDSISKSQFLARVTNTGIDPGRSYYAFDCHGARGIVLDANFRADGTDYDRGNFDWTDANVPGHELSWLGAELAAARGPVIVFVHQLLDGTDSVCVRNASEVRELLEDSRKVLAVFQGHHHEGRYRTVNGIDYYTLAAMVEGPAQEDNSYAIVEVRRDLSVSITGYRKATSADLQSNQIAQAD